MLYPPVADMLKHVSSRYLLVNVIANRARQIAEEAEAFHEELKEKPVMLNMNALEQARSTQKTSSLETQTWSLQEQARQKSTQLLNCATMYQEPAR
mgnify:CR=1 FL=1